MNIVITGSTGFVGRHLLSHFLKTKHNITALVRNQLTSSDITYYQYSLNETFDFSSMFENIDVIIHCAARVHVMKDSAVDPLAEYMEVNLKGTINLAKQAAKAGVKRFIFLSSIKVNGESTTNKDPYTAFDIPKPNDPYGLSKLEAEKQLLTLAEQTGMEVVIIRSPLVYGEGVGANFYSLMKFINKGFPLPFRAIDCNKRSLVSVYNLVDLIDKCIDHTEAVNQVFLVSDNNDLSTAEIVSLMSYVQSKNNVSLPVPIWCFKLIGKLLSKTNVVDRLTGSLQLDISHTQRTLDWHPPYSVEYGFKLAATNNRSEE